MKSGRIPLLPYTSPFKKTAALLSMMRLPNCLMIGFAVIVGEVIASQTVPVRAAFYGFIAGSFLLGASMILNDYFDREIDAINQPRRPLPAGLVKPIDVISFAIVLISLGLFFAANSGTGTLVLAVISLLIMLLYNAKIKKFGVPGNALVSVNVAIPFIYGGFAVGNPTWPLTVFAILAFLTNMGREIVKGIVDVPGDATKGVKTFAATNGNPSASKLGASFFLAAVALSILPIVLRLVSVYYLPLVAICDIGLILTAYSVITDSRPQNAKRNKKFSLVWMIFGLLAFVLGSF